eukprot:4742146-Pyramimonas_sp.AAC.1
MYGADTKGSCTTRWSSGSTSRFLLSRSDWHSAHSSSRMACQVAPRSFMSAHTASSVLHLPSWHVHPAANGQHPACAVGMPIRK